MTPEDESKFMRMMVKAVDNLKPYIEKLVEKAVGEIPYRMRQFMLESGEQAMREFVSEEIRKQVLVHVRLRKTEE